MAKLLAPNGKPSNLSPEQYELVRRPEFKAWFGDWENNPESASKVVDSNGEPLPVYHGTNNDFNTFDKSKIGLNHWQSKSDLYGGGFFFTDKKNKAFRGKVKEVFLKIEKPLLNVFEDKYGYEVDYYHATDNFDLNSTSYFQRAKENRNNGIIIKTPRGSLYVAFEPEQIKLADGTNTTFDGNNPDIRFDVGGVIENELSIIIKGVTNENKYKGNYKKIFDLIEKDLAFYNPYGTSFEELRDNDFYITITPKPESSIIDKISKLQGVEIVDNDIRFDKGGLIAPNGKRSYLTPEQYLLVRTPEFKSWFGDWENLILTKINDSGIDEISLKRLEDGVSKVVDKNGEPMVVWHTTNNEFNKFDKRKSRDGFFFSPQKNRLVVYNKSKINSYFLNLRNPSHEIFKLDLKYLKPKGYDGIMDYGHDKKSGNENLYEIIAFEPNQIKLADGTNTTFDGNNPDIRFDEGGETQLNEEAQQYIDIISMNPKLEKYQKYKVILKDKFGIDFDSIYKDQEYIDKANLNDIKKQDDFLDFDNWLNYAEIISKKRGFVRMDSYLTPSDKYKLTDEIWNETSKNLDFIIKKIPYTERGTGSGDIARAFGDTIYYTDHADFYYFLHELGHIYNFQNNIEGIIKNPAYSPTNYGTTNGGETFAENFAIYFINPMALKNWNEDVYNAMDLEINEKYKNEINRIMPNNNDITFENGGDVIVNPTEIECHTCHWKWKVKDGGDDLFICHKCYTDNTKYYKFEGLEGEKILDTISYAKGGRTIAQTPAPKKDQIKGSDKNKEGSSKDLTSAKKIELSDKTIEAIKNKVDKHNEKHPKKKITIDSAKAVVRRGMGAYSSSYRPTIKGGKPNSRVAWGLARLNAFIYKIVNGKSKSGKYSQDNDLIEELGYKVQKYADGGEIANTMRKEIIDILSKNARYGKQILSVQEVGLEVIQSCIKSYTYFGNAIRQANENYIMIPINYEDKLFAIDKKVEYIYFSKPNETTKIRIEYKYDMQDYPVPVLFDSELMNNEEYFNINDYEEIKSREFDSEFLYRGINNDEMLSIIDNGFIKSNASMNIGKQQEETTSFAQHISQASSYAVGFNAWYDEVTFAKPKYILKVKKEGVNYKPTIETDIQNEVDVFGEIPIQQIESIYEIKLGECQMGSVEINVGYENNFSEGSRFPMFKKVFVRKTDVSTLINEINSKNKIEKNNDMTNSNPKDTITMDIPLLIRFAELMREDIKTDVDLHRVVENLIQIKDKGILTMDDYGSIVGNVTGTEENTNTDAVEEEKMADGGKVNSIKSKKGDIKISLDENWYSDDTKVELVPVSELMKFREFDRKVKPKYNQENSRDNINHLKFMFEKNGVKEPLIIEYSAQDKAVLVIEGNHRINSAIDLGMEYLPARVVLKKYSKFTPSQLKNSMKVEGIKANSSNYIPSDLKPSQIGITGAMPIYGDGGIIEGRLHSECGDDGCGRKFQVGEDGHIIEAERDEAVIVANAFKSNEELTIKGTLSEVASALNVVGGGKNFDKGATIIKNGSVLEIPELKKQATNTDVDDIIDPSSIIINRRSMADTKKYEVTGTPKQIASAINSINGNGVVIENGAEIKEN
jgi:hypothetical protein